MSDSKGDSDGLCSKSDLSAAVIPDIGVIKQLQRLLLENGALLGVSDEGIQFGLLAFRHLQETLASRGSAHRGVSEARGRRIAFDGDTGSGASDRAPQIGSPVTAEVVVQTVESPRNDYCDATAGTTVELNLRYGSTPEASFLVEVDGLETKPPKAKKRRRVRERQGGKSLSCMLSMETRMKRAYEKSIEPGAVIADPEKMCHTMAREDAATPDENTNSSDTPRWTKRARDAEPSDHEAVGRCDFGVE
jgi:hypothetical protein